VFRVHPVVTTVQFHGQYKVVTLRSLLRVRVLFDG